MTTVTPDIDIIVKHLEKASEAYYNGNPIVTDAEFDVLRDKLEELDPKNTFLSEVGAPKSLKADGQHTNTA